MVAKKLNDKQARFVEEYVIDFNATRAAIAAGYSKKTAEQQGYQLLQKTLVQEAVATNQKKVAAKLEITQEKTLIEIARLAFSDLRKAFDEDGNLLPVNKWPDDIAAAISSVKVITHTSEDGEVSHTSEVKLWDKGTSQERLCKHLGLFEKHNEQKSNPVADLLNALHGNQSAGMPANDNP